MAVTGGALVDEDLEALVSAAAGEDGLLADFARRYLARIPEAYIARHGNDAVAAQVRSVFSFYSERRPPGAVVRAFNPTTEADGYDTGGAVVEVSCQDMAFLVDSVTNGIVAAGHAVERVFHPVLGVSRDADGALAAIRPARSAAQRDSVQHYELSRRLDEEECKSLEEAVRVVLRDVGRAVADFEPMQGAVYRMIKTARDGGARYSQLEIGEAVSFLEWLLEDNFVFLGYREYSIEDTPDGRAVALVPGTGLGILGQEDTSGYAQAVPLSTLPDELRARYEGGDLVVITKTNSLARVHRHAKMDYIGVRRIAPDGTVVGETRLLGLFTSKAYMAPVRSIPILRARLEEILQREDTMEGSHYHKQLVELFESFPKDELFSTPIDAIHDSIVGLVALQEGEQVRLFVRRDLLQRSVSVLVAMPRDRFNAALRHRLQQLFLERFDGTSIDYRLAMGDSPTARLHFTIWVDQQRDTIPYADLEAEVIALTRTWEEQVSELLVERYGADEGRRLADDWLAEFPSYYRSSVSRELTVGDIARLEELVSDTGGPVVGLQNEVNGAEHLTRLAVYKADGKLRLSEVMPTLEALGLSIVEEVPTRLRESGIVIHDFGVVDGEGNQLDIDACGARVADAVRAVLTGEGESDSLNRLIVSSPLDYRQVGILRAYRTYWRRVSPSFTIEYVNDALANHPATATLLYRLFEARFDPAADPGVDFDARVADVETALDAVTSLDEDRILRGFLGLIQATVRTSAYRPDRAGLSFKFRSFLVPGMPQPAPLFEIFVYAPDVEGIHLRGGRVARGGLRWSTRREDYRTEVLGLMKAQMTKNAVIVPTGAKGGFVLRRPIPDPPHHMEAVRSAYTTFIRGLLDVTDNLVGGAVVHPPSVRIHDTDDPYLVVAADKGTATFSDTANAIAADYGFWLGDAFASGGSAGYDHKALGITARGAWESVKWHFRELGIDVMSQPFTAVGIGDMSGDVFGNGMLISDQLRLVAAFDHRDIFIDPDPDPTRSHQERQRLFTTPGSRWQDYDPSLISPGGGVFSRQAKKVDLSEQARRALDIPLTEATPDEVIHAILTAPVDLLWNGGIGTYVKATVETHTDVGDRTNDTLRANGAELRCRVVGEGGNLGFTQLGRIEYAGNGGRINADFIDNSGGVHCSDREVNLKVLLGLAEERGEMDRAGRDTLVAAVADDVVEAILYDNYLQAQILAQETASAPSRMEAYEDLMAVLESLGVLDRSLEWLPGTDEMAERTRAGKGLTSPELAVLLAYAKQHLSEQVLASDLPDAGWFEPDLVEYFPAPVVERFGELIDEHPLRRELIATIVANEVVNAEGITFVTRLGIETGSSADEVVVAYHIAREVTQAANLWDDVEGVGGAVAPDVQRSLLEDVDSLVESVARWYLSHGRDGAMGDVEVVREAFKELADTIGGLGPGEWEQRQRKAAKAWEKRGVPPELAIRHALIDELTHAPDIIELSFRTGRSLGDVAGVFLAVGPQFQIDWLERQVETVPAATRWHRGALRVVGDDLIVLRRELAERVMSESDGAPPQEAMDRYVERRAEGVQRLARMMRSLAVDGVDDVSGLVVAIRQIRALVG